MDYCEWVESQRGKTPSITTWEGIEAEVISDPQVSTHAGTVRKSWVGDHVVMTRVVVKANSVGKMHRHVSEQVSIIMRGAVTVRIDGSPEFRASAGSIVFIPGNRMHMFEILGEETEIFDVYSIERNAEELRKFYS